MGLPKIHTIAYLFPIERFLWRLHIYGFTKKIKSAFANELLMKLPLLNTNELPMRLPLIIPNELPMKLPLVIQKDLQNKIIYIYILMEQTF